MLSNTALIVNFVLEKRQSLSKEEEEEKNEKKLALKAALLQAAGSKKSVMEENLAVISKDLKPSKKT